MLITNNDIIKKAIEKYGEKNQLIVAIEELSELQKELTKYLRGIGNDEHIAEETADVRIMLSQIETIFNNRGLVLKYEVSKLERLKHRIDETS